jgi:hypothetical protein
MLGVIKPAAVYALAKWRHMDTLKLKLIYRESCHRLRDAEILERAALLEDDVCVSVYLLRLLGLELQLKFVYLIENNKEDTKGLGHNYQKIFEKLNEQTKTRLIELAVQRIGHTALSTDTLLVLKTWGDNFIDLRYPYEKYEGQSEAEYLAKGREWIENGAPLEQATFCLYPCELYGFLEALNTVCRGHAIRLFGP